MRGRNEDELVVEFCFATACLVVRMTVHLSSARGRDREKLVQRPVRLRSLVRRLAPATASISVSLLRSSSDTWPLINSGATARVEGVLVVEVRLTHGHSSSQVQGS